MQIISVTPLDKRRSKVLTDEDFAFALYQGEIKAYKIKEGGELTGEVYWEILEKVLFKRAKERTLYLLNYGRNYSRTYGDRKSRRQLEFERRNKGLDRDTIDLLMEECQVSEDEQIYQFLRKKGYEKDTAQPKERARLTAALARKGFSYDAICRVMEGGEEGGF